MFKFNNLVNFTKKINFENNILGPVKNEFNTRYIKTVQNKMCSSIIWIDLEMSGLDVKREKILEASCLITDGNLDVIAESETIIINQPDSVLNNMNEWCKEHHEKSNLIASVRNSKITTEQAEQQLVEFLTKYVPKGECPLAGNSVHYDRLFLKEYMPKVNEYMHYRIIDVSTVKELCKRWNPNAYSNAPAKKLTHRALEDIKESIKELKYYKKCFFNVPENE